MGNASAFQDLTTEETAYLEACLARHREMIALSGKSPSGQILAVCEEAAVDMAKATACELLSAGINSAIAEVEKKGVTHGRASAIHAARTVGRINARS
jgi:hypothetical protein